MAKSKFYPVQLPAKLHKMLKELTPEGHTLISTIWDAVNLLKKKRKERVSDKERQEVNDLFGGSME